MGFDLSNIKKNNERISPSKKTSSDSFLKKEITFFNTPFGSKIKEGFYSEVSVLLDAGVTLKQVLELLENGQKKQQNKAILSQLSNDIVAGRSLSEAVKKQKPFSQYEYYALKIGEETGTLSQVTKQLGEYYERKNEQRRNLISALTYPVIILSTAVLVVVFMLRFVVPMFQDIFKQQNVELPGITKVIIAASDFLRDYGWIMLIGFITVLILRPLLSKKVWYKTFKDKFTLKLPFIGNFVKTVYLSQFTQAVSLLTASKVPVVNSIQLVKQMIQFYPLQQALGAVEKDILQGHSLSNSLAKHKLFSDKMVALVKVAEETNQNELIFNRLNKQYNIQVQQESKILSTVMEPIIILIVGVLVGVILIAMYLPMFKLSSVIG